MAKINVLDKEIYLFVKDEEDYISITDIARLSDRAGRQAHSWQCAPLRPLPTHQRVNWQLQSCRSSEGHSPQGRRNPQSAPERSHR